jgi:tetratricopeptide (TPR) repeat protein
MLRAGEAEGPTPAGGFWCAWAGRSTWPTRHFGGWFYATLGLLQRFVFAAILASALAARAGAQGGGQLDASPSLFTVMAAINAAGYDAELDSPNNHPLRHEVRAELAKRTIPSLPALKAFFAKNRKRNETAELSQYISFALSTSGPPAFTFTAHELDIPPDAAALRDLAPLLASFYKEANIDDLWKRSQRAIDQYVARYHEPVTNAVLQVNAYMRQQTSGFRGRHFQVFIELLGAPNQIQTRSYGNEYTIVITPSPEPRIFDVRHAYLHYLLDLLATRNEEVLKRKQGISDHAQRAQALPDSFKDDFLLLATESLIKAVEARLDHKPDLAQQALLEGYILTPYFYERLAVYEKQETAMTLYYPEMVGGIDLIKEDARLSKVEFAKEAAVKTVKNAPPPPLPPVTGVAKTLQDAEELYKTDNLDKAKQLFLSVLEQTNQKSAHASAYYGLARIAVKQKDPETGERLFQKSLELEPEPFVKAWALVFLGRLNVAAGEREPALKYFQSALAVEGASDEAKRQAQIGVQQNSK